MPCLVSSACYRACHRGKQLPLPCVFRRRPCSSLLSSAVDLPLPSSIFRLLSCLPVLRSPPYISLSSSFPLLQRASLSHVVDTDHSHTHLIHTSPTRAGTEQRHETAAHERGVRQQRHQHHSTSRRCAEGQRGLAEQLAGMVDPGVPPRIPLRLPLSAAGNSQGSSQGTIQPAGGMTEKVHQEEASVE